VGGKIYSNNSIISGISARTQNPGGNDDMMWALALYAQVAGGKLKRQEVE